VTQPCRTFQQAFNTMRVNGEIDVLDAGGYGPLNITGGGISIQAHGFAGITAASGDAITIAVTTSDPVTLNGLLIEGAGTGNFGINILQGPSVQILNCVVRHFQTGIVGNTSTNGSNLLVEDTVASDNGVGISLNPFNSNTQTMLNRITASNNYDGVVIASGVATIANSVMSNNSHIGLYSVYIVNAGGTTWLSKSVISGNPIGISLAPGAVNSYGDNYIANNGLPLAGSLTPVGMQ
jgi:hypothetical protein